MSDTVGSPGAQAIHEWEVGQFDALAGAGGPPICARKRARTDAVDGFPRSLLACGASISPSPPHSSGPKRMPLARRLYDGITENEDMDRESVERLRFDRRLQGRRDWVGQDAAQANLDALPDVSDNMTTAAELEAEEEAARAR